MPHQVEADVGQVGEVRLLSGLPGDKREDEQPEAVDESSLEQLAYQRQAADGPQVGVPGLQPTDGPDEVVADGCVGQETACRVRENTVVGVAIRLGEPSS